MLKNSTRIVPVVVSFVGTLSVVDLVEFKTR